jgi:hypothetical protein
MPLNLAERLAIADIRQFRNERIKKIKKGETPKPLDRSTELAKIAVHLVPMQASDPARIHSLSQLSQDLGPLKPPYASINNCEYSFNGFCVYSHPVQGSKGSVRSYVHVFHTGTIEVVDMRFLSDGHFRGQAFTVGLIQAIPAYLSVQKKLDVSLPIFIMLSLVHVKEYELSPGESFESRPIEEEDVLVPEIRVDAWDADPTKLMKPAFDVVWNALGLPESPA